MNDASATKLMGIVFTVSVLSEPRNTGTRDASVLVPSSASTLDTEASYAPSKQWGKTDATAAALEYVRMTELAACKCEVAQRALQPPTDPRMQQARTRIPQSRIGS